MQILANQSDFKPAIPQLPPPDNRVISTDNTPDNSAKTVKFSRFITLGHLAKQFDEQEITIRRAFKKLFKDGLLREGTDYFKADYLNERNFTYKIDPDKFIELIKQTDISPDNKGDITLISLKEKYIQKQSNVGNASDSKTKPEIEQKTVDENTQTTDKIAEEFINYLKNQVKEKDDYIKRKENYLMEKDKDYKRLFERLNRREHTVKNLIHNTSQLEAKVLMLEEKYKPEPLEFVIKKKGLWGRLFSKR
jgi:hypothetical protein